MLDHVQRGAAPGASGRLLGTRLDAGAVDHLAACNSGVLMGLLGGQVGTTPLAAIAGRTQGVDDVPGALAHVLAT